MSMLGVYAVLGVGVIVALLALIAEFMWKSKERKINSKGVPARFVNIFLNWYYRFVGDHCHLLRDQKLGKAISHLNHVHNKDFPWKHFGRQRSSTWPLNRKEFLVENSEESLGLFTRSTLVRTDILASSGELNSCVSISWSTKISKLPNQFDYVPATLSLAISGGQPSHRFSYYSVKICNNVNRTEWAKYKLVFDFPAQN